METNLNVLLDTDAGGDCDDMVALAYLIYAKQYLGVNIKGITHSQGCAHGTTLIRTFFRHLNESTPPLGCASLPIKSYDYYCKTVVSRFALPDDYKKGPDAVSVMRQALVQSDQLVICAIGPFSNLTALLESGADAISPLSGISLLQKKCAKIVVMAGDFRHAADPEWNISVDISAAQRFIKSCPVPIIFLPFETGLNIYTGKEHALKYQESTPLSLSFLCYPDIDLDNGRHSWDSAALLYAVQGCGDYFEESPLGTVTVDNTGRVHMEYHANGLHQILTIKKHHNCSEQQCKDKIAEYIDACIGKLYS